MDGTEILFTMKDRGYTPQNKKENEFVNDLVGEGFATIDRETRQYKLLPNVIVEDGIEKIKLSCLPQIKYLGLFFEKNNFIPALEVRPNNVHILLNYLGALKFIDWKRALGEHRLGDMIEFDIVGYGKNDNNEGYKVELPQSARDLYYSKDKKEPCFTIGLSKRGRERDTSSLEFKPIRRSVSKAKLGVLTSLGVFYNKEELDNAKKELVIDKTEFYN